ncbi:MAG TPA: T9SS type A sorting domain-containing protein [Flavobacterium sp.]|nr:T9SS type A sorting domain-containing protein [Flavobacterium sp.]
MKKTTFLLLFFCTFSFSQTPVAFYPTSDASGIMFGTAVDISGTDIAVSSGWNFATGPTSMGKVYVFSNDGTLSQVNDFYPEDAPGNDAYGLKISISNNFLAIGSLVHDLPVSNCGAVYVHRKVNGIWQSNYQKITAPDASANDHFGSYVKVVGNLLFVSATEEESETSQPDVNSGAVYVYKFNGTEWAFSQKLTATNTEFGVHQFGSKIETDGNRVMIASNNGNVTGYNFIYLYEINNDNVVFQNSIGPLGNLEFIIKDFTLANDQIYFVAFGIPGIMDNFNGVNIMSENEGNWILSGGFNVAQSDQIFSKIVVSGDNVFLGSDTYILAMERKFPLLHYRLNGETWNLQNTFYSGGPSASDDFFGSVLAVSGNNLLIGAPQEGTFSAGKAYIFDVTLGTSKFDKAGVSVYPNPTADKLFVKASGKDIEKAEVYSVTGKLLLTQENPTELSLQNLATGMYLVKLTSAEGQNQTFKIIKN